MLGHYFILIFCVMVNIPGIILSGFPQYWFSIAAGFFCLGILAAAIISDLVKGG